MPNGKTALIDLHYLPSIAFFTVLFKYEKVIFEIEENFIKQTYRNRCHILAANKVDKLSVPVIGGRKKIKVKDITIDHTQRWQKDHWRAITSAYGRAPFFEFFADHFEPAFSKKEKYLLDLNQQLLTICLKLLQADINFTFTEVYEKEPSDARVEDLRSVVHPKTSYSANNVYMPQVYPQVFGNNFVANLSIIDLLFCEGPNANGLVTKSIKKE